MFCQALNAKQKDVHSHIHFIYIYVYIIQLRVVGDYPSCHLARGRVHPVQVASPSL